MTAMMLGLLKAVLVLIDRVRDPKYCFSRSIYFINSLKKGQKISEQDIRHIRLIKFFKSIRYLIGRGGSRRKSWR